MDNNWTVYAHINKIDGGKTYVGITSNVEQRWNPSGYKSCTRFYSAIEEYGWDNFDHIILISGICRELASIIEIELIKKFNLQNWEYGYNIANGGFGLPKFPRNKVLYQYDLNGEYIREWENAKIAAKTLKLNYTGLCSAARGDQHYYTNGGYQWRFEKHDKINPYVPYDQHKKHPPICRFDVDGNLIATYDNIWDYGFTDSEVHDIVNCCNGNYYKSRLESIWLWESDSTKEKIENAISVYKNRWYGFQEVKKVCQYSLDGKLLNVFESCTEASSITHINYDTIQGACRIKSKTHQACGYLWYYYVDTEGCDVKPYKNKFAGKEILYFSSDGQFIKKYKNENGIWILASIYDQVKEQYNLEKL